MCEIGVCTGESVAQTELPRVACSSATFFGALAAVPEFKVIPERSNPRRIDEGRYRLFAAGTHVRLPAGGNFFVGHSGCPISAVIVDEVMRLAGEAPVPDRGPQRHRLAVEREPPTGCGIERGDNLATAAASAPMNRGCVFQADVEHALLDALGYRIDEDMTEDGCPHAISLFRSWLLTTV